MNQTDPIVFVVDDDESVLRSLERLLRSVGLNTETFLSADDFLNREPPDIPSCLILDVRMPGISGLDLQEELSSKGFNMPIIIITGHGTIPMSVRAMKAGAIDFIQKPFNDQELLDTIHHALEQDKIAIKKRAEISQIQGCVDSLTNREKEVFALVVTGMLNKQIAFELEISEKTIKVHRARVMQKMNADSLADLVRMADRVGIRHEKE